MLERAEVRGGCMGCLQEGKERKEVVLRRKDSCRRRESALLSHILPTQCPLGPLKAPITSQTVPIFPSHTTTTALAFLACSRDPLGHCGRLGFAAQRSQQKARFWLLLIFLRGTPGCFEVSFSTCPSNIIVLCLLFVS